MENMSESDSWPVPSIHPIWIKLERNIPSMPGSISCSWWKWRVARVEEIGSGVIGLKSGDLVIPSKPALGTIRESNFDYLNIWLSEYVLLYLYYRHLEISGCFKAGDFVKIPDKWCKLPYEVLATLNVNPPTAYRLLKDFVPLKSGDLVVQNGGKQRSGPAGNSDGWAIMGARTLNVVRDRPDFDTLAHELTGMDPSGGASVIKPDDLCRSQVDGAVLGLNCVGGAAVADMAKVMKSDGVIVTYRGDEPQIWQFQLRR